MKKILVFSILVMLMLAGLSMPCFAARVTTKSIDVSAYIQPLNGGLNVSVWKVTPPAKCVKEDITHKAIWLSAPSMAFGTLWFDLRPDPTRNGAPYKVWRSGTNENDGFYYAVEVDVVDNVNTSWTITHTRTDFVSGANKLNNNVNVTFQKVVYNDADKVGYPEGNPIYKVTYQDSNGKTVTNSQLKSSTGKQGWLRILYGLGTGIGSTSPNPDGCELDAADNMAILQDQPSGTYNGQVTLTLAP